MRGPLVIDEKLEIPETDLSYEYAKSGGPGGQHVNKTDSRARLRFDLAACEVLSAAVKARLRESNRTWLTADGAIVLTSDSHRSQHRNTEIVRERLAEAIRAALVPPKQRRKTKPSRRSQAKRIEGKRRRGDLKASRKRPDRDD